MVYILNILVWKYVWSITVYKIFVVQYDDYLNETFVGRDRMVVGLTAIYAISVYHH